MDTYSKLNSIKEKIKSTSDLTIIKESLASASTLLLSPSPLDNIWEQAYGQFTTFLLDNVFVDWSSCFTTRERETLFDSFFIHCPSFEAPLLAITNYAFSPTSQLMDRMDQTYIMEYIEGIVSLYYVRRDYVSKLVSERISLEISANNGKLDPKVEHIVTIIGSLPDRFNNKMQGKTSDALLPEQYFSNIVRQVMEVFGQQTKAGTKDSIKIAAQVISRFIAKIAKLGHSVILAREILSREKRWKETKNEMALASQVFACTPTVSVEAILDSLLRIAATKYNSPERIIYLGGLFSSNESFSFLLEKFLTQRTYSKQSINLLLELILSYSNMRTGEITKDCFAIKCTISMLKMWSDTNFVQHTPIRRHRQITRAVQFFVSKTNRALLESSLMPMLVRGVQAHMQSPQRDIRVLGMKTAEVFSAVLDPEKPLKFEEDLNDSDDDIEEPLLPPLHSAPSSIPGSSTEEGAKDGESVKRAQIDPDEEIGDGFGTEDVGEDDDDEEDLQPYNLEDDESDLHPHAKQYYLRDCLAIFQQSSEKLDLDVFKGAISSIERIVRSKPDDLDEVSEQLARSLLRARSEFSDEEYTQNRLQALVALAVHSPTIVVGFLVKQFYETNYSLAQRMLVLDVLVAAAKELSTISAHEKQVQSPSDLNIIGKVIRKGTTQPRLQHTQNIPFYPLATLFVYPLMAKFDNKGNSFNMLGEDSIVLSRLVYALGTFMECAGNSPHSRQIGRDLFDFLWTIRLHRQAVVRRGVLFALSKIMQVFAPYMLLEDFSNKLDEIQMWLYAIVNTDTDDNTRVMGQAVMFKLVESMQAHTSVGRLTL